MVSLKKIFKRYKYFFLLASLFILGTSAKSFAAFDIDDSKLAWICVIGETKCCVNGAKSCCEDNGTLYDTWSCDDSCGISGTKQYKYTADSGCGYSTSTRTCCSSGSWSGWDAACPPEPKQCPTSSKPESKRTCYGGYQRRTVSCNTSTGTWTTGSWGDCDCSDSEFELVTALGGGSCCQRKDGTGLRCAGDPGLAYQWVAMGTPCWDKIDCGTGALPECNESMKGTYWSKWISDNSWNSGCGSQYPYINGRGYCQQYMCR